MTETMQRRPTMTDRQRERRARALWEKKGLEPLVPFPGSRVGWPSRHTACGRQVAPRFDNLRYRPTSTGCEYCAGRARISTAEALATLAEADLEPLARYPGSQLNWSCRCLRCGSEDAEPRLSVLRTTGRRGCRGCRESGRG